MSNLPTISQSTFKLCPDWVTWIGVDDDGVAAGFKHEPLFKKSLGAYICDVSEYDTDYVFIDGHYSNDVTLLQREEK